MEEEWDSCGHHQKGRRSGPFNGANGLGKLMYDGVTEAWRARGCVALVPFVGVVGYCVAACRDPFGGGEQLE